MAKKHKAGCDCYTQTKKESIFHEDSALQGFPELPSVFPDWLMASNTIAFGGVATGNMKAYEQQIAAGRAK